MPVALLQKLSASMGAALVVVGLFGGVSYYYASRIAVADSAVERANANVSAAFRIIVATQDGERATKAYVVRADTVTRSLLRDAQSQVEDAVDALRIQSEDNPHQRQLLDGLSRQVAARFGEFNSAAALRDHYGADSARRFLTREMPPGEADSLMRYVAQMREEEVRVLGEHTRLYTSTAGRAQHIILAGMIFAFLLAGIALQPMRTQVAQRLTSRIVVAHTARLDAQAEEADAPTSATMLRELHALVLALSDVADPGAAAQALAASAASTLRAALSAVIVPDGAGGLTVLAASHAGFTSVAPDLARPVADALRAAQPVIVESRALREAQWGTLALLDAQGARGAVLLVPLTGSGAARGVLVVALAEDHAFSDDELDFASTLGRLGGPAVAARSFIS